jgi:hypothetical protein
MLIDFLLQGGTTNVGLAIIRHSKTYNVHFMKRAQWKRLPSFNMTLNCMSDIRDNHKEWLGSAPAPTIQSNLALSDYHVFGGLEKSYMRPALKLEQ